MITIQNIASHELTGLGAKVVKSANSQLIGLNGTVLYETKNMLVIWTRSGQKSIPKRICTWHFEGRGVEAEVAGTAISRRPYERIKS